MNRWLKSLNPFQILVIGYVAMIFLGSALLWLPWARTAAASSLYVDALFTAASAATTTGLVVHDTGAYTLLGQLIILALIEVSGLGYMMFIALLVMGAKRSLSFGSRMLLRESLGRPSSMDMLHFSRIIFRYSMWIQGISVVVMGLYFTRYFDVGHAFYTALFHTISAFCTAGFSLYGDSMSAFPDDWFISIGFSVVSILGGIGFFVLYDVAQWLPKFFREQTPRRLSAHTKFALLMTAVILVGGTFAVHFSEVLHGDADSTFLTSMFHVIMASTTTGFNSLNVGEFATSTHFVIMGLMFIGGSPGSTAGGIKTTGLGIMLFFVPQVMLGRNDIHIFSRRITPSQINRAFALSFIAVIWAAGGTMLLGFSEDAPIFPLMFEVVSALSTGGLSTGITADLSVTGKVFLTATMLIGRIGTLALGFSLIGKPRKLTYRYPDADVLIG